MNVDFALPPAAAIAGGLLMGTAVVYSGVLNRHPRAAVDLPAFPSISPSAGGFMPSRPHHLLDSIETRPVRWDFYGLEKAIDKCAPRGIGDDELSAVGGTPKARSSRGDLYAVHMDQTMCVADKFGDMAMQAPTTPPASFSRVVFFAALLAALQSCAASLFGSFALLCTAWYLAAAVLGISIVFAAPSVCRALRNAAYSAILEVVLQLVAERVAVDPELLQLRHDLSLLRNDLQAAQQGLKTLQDQRRADAARQGLWSDDLDILASQLRDLAAQTKSLQGRSAQSGSLAKQLADLAKKVTALSSPQPASEPITGLTARLEELATTVAAIQSRRAASAATLRGPWPLRYDANYALGQRLQHVAADDVEGVIAALYHVVLVELQAMGSTVTRLQRNGQQPMAPPPPFANQMMAQGPSSPFPNQMVAPQQQPSPSFNAPPHFGGQGRWPQ